MNISSNLAAEVLGVTRKRFDNALFALRDRLELHGRQGKAREISLNQLELLAVVLLLQRDLGISLGDAFPLARTLVGSESGVAKLGVLGSLHFDMPRLRSVLQQALAGTVEDYVAPLRGRPKAIK
jgi:hypothetical protein